MTQEQGKELDLKDFELMIEALTDAIAKYYDKKRDAIYAKQEAVEKRYSQRQQRAELLKEMFTNEIKRIRNEKFEVHKKSKRWNRALEGNTNKLVK